jgi:peptidoglycan/xylan/chitin deacetylase (PgdA/CDA1 family)
LNHLPCSVNGKSAYNIKGTCSVAEVIAEIIGNDQKIKSLSNCTPCYYRSGTDYYDEVAVNIASDLGYQAVGYSVLGDAGATYTREQVKKALLDARAGSIVIFHFNHPEGETAEGIMDAIPILEKNGFRFVKLSTFPLIKYP